MNKSTLLLIVAASMLCAIASIALAFLGWSYDTLGYGLHPMVSYPMATLVFVAPLSFVVSLK